MLPTNAGDTSGMIAQAMAIYDTVGGKKPSATPP